jgi:TolA-binding protein
MEHLEQIELYLDGKLQGEELAGFTREMETNPSLKAEVADYKEIISGIKLSGEKDFVALVAQWEKDIRVAEKINEQKSTTDITENQLDTSKTEGKKEGVKKKFHAMRWFMGFSAAACIAVILFVGNYLFLGKDSPSELFKDNFEPYNSVVEVRGNGSDFEEAMAKYAGKDYQGAIVLYENILKKTPDSTVVNFYAGISYLATNNTQNAENQLLKVVKSENELFAEKAQWYMALSALKQDNKPLAKERLGVIAKEEGHEFRVKAENLLKNL